MKRFLALWLVLAAAFALTRLAVAISLSATLDLRIAAFVEVIVVPGVQAAAVAWALRARQGPSPLAPWRAAFGSPVVRVAVVLEVACWVAACFPSLPLSLRFAERWGVPRLLLSATLVAASVLWGREALRRRPTSSRIAAGALTLLLTLLAIEPFTRWLEDGPRRLFPTEPLLVQWLRFEPPLLLALLVTLLATQASLLPRQPLASRALDWVAALLLVVSATLVIGFFLHPFLREPWFTFAWIVGSAAVLGAALAGQLAARPDPQLAP
jgi:hypothetical protein